LFGGEASTQIARDLAEEARKRNFRPRLVAMDDFKQCDLETSPATAIFVVETIENAQPSEAAGRCLRFYNRKRKAGEKDLFKNKLRYAVLGLGDTNLLLDRQTTTAKDCNQAAQTLDSALLFLGGERLVTRGEANDAVGLEEAVEPWREALWPQLEKSPSAARVQETSDRAAESKTFEPRVRFLYGSQTGNAAEICKAMDAEASGSKRLNTTCSSMNEVDVRDALQPGNVLVYVVSSTGDGDAPDDCDAFFTKLKRAVKASPGEIGLGTQYCVLGLGDQNYSAFMAVPRSFSAAMEKAGATAFYPRGEADDTLGLYEYAESWQEGLWEPLRRAVTNAPSFKANPEQAATIAREGNAKTKPKTEFEAKASRAPEESAETKPAETSPRRVSVVASETIAPMEGVPSLPACRASVVWLADADASSRIAQYPLGTTRSKPEDGSDCFSASRPYLAPVAEKTLMTSPSSDRRVLHVEFDVSAADSNALAYEPGDSLGVLPSNDPVLVEAVAKRLRLDLDARFDLTWAPGFEASAATPLPHIKRPCTVRDALTHCVDLTSPARKSQLRVFAEFCDESDPGKHTLLTLCSKRGKARYAAEIVEERPSILDLLMQTAPSCFVGDAAKMNNVDAFAAFLDACPPLQPRMYSITTAPEVRPGRPAVAFSVVAFPAPSGAIREGVATNWLDRLDASRTRVPVFVRRAATFKPPDDITTPTLMIGPGTGVAPFRGFLQRRAALLRRSSPDWNVRERGPCWLFFGCRDRDEDYLYREDLEGFEKSGVLDVLRCAFSRADPRRKVYVQDLIREMKEDVARLVSSPNARVFVCGDGGGMARDVHSALRDAVASLEGVDEAAAEGLLSAMTKEGRYVRDIWS
jgi:NADPH-ferrihemoprotein reductase